MNISIRIVVITQTSRAPRAPPYDPLPDISPALNGYLNGSEPLRLDSLLTQIPGYMPGKIHLTKRGNNSWHLVF